MAACMYPIAIRKQGLSASKYGLSLYSLETQLAAHLPQ